MHTALLVIDVQQGLCEGEHDAFESQLVIARINTVFRKHSECVVGRAAAGLTGRSCLVTRTPRAAMKTEGIQ